MTKVFSMPLYEIRLSLTGRCNYNCVYCGPFADGKSSLGYGDLTIGQIKTLLPLLKKANLHIQITGGEPTLRDDLEEIIGLLSEEGITDIGLTTNGYKLSEEYVLKLINKGISDVHVHLSSLDPLVYQKTANVRNEGVINIIKKVAILLKEKGIGIEFNTPVTHINFSSLDTLLNFCYENKINLKLIEEVNLSNKNIKETDIISFVENWFHKKGLNLSDDKIEKKYGRIYMMDQGFAFRIAPATKGLVDYLNEESDKVLYDGRYWIGGINGQFLFTPSYFLEPTIGNYEDLKKNFSLTLSQYLKYFNHEK